MSDSFYLPLHPCLSLSVCICLYLSASFSQCLSLSPSLSLSFSLTPTWTPVMSLHPLDIASFAVPEGQLLKTHTLSPADAESTLCPYPRAGEWKQQPLNAATALANDNQQGRGWGLSVETVMFPFSPFPCPPQLQLFLFLI